MIRAELPFGLELLPCFWKNLVGLPLDPNSDLRDADVITYNYIKNFETVRHLFTSIFPCRGRFMKYFVNNYLLHFFIFQLESEEELACLFPDQLPRFVYTTLNDQQVELIPDGKNVVVR